MRKTYQVLAYALAVEVVIQAMAIAYAMAGLGKWIEDDGGVLNKAKLDSDEDLPFRGFGGFVIHGLNGMMLIPLITLALLVVSFFAHVEEGTKRALILVGMVVLQVVLGITLHSVVYLAPLHVINAFGILVFAYQTAKRTSVVPLAPPVTV
jgi:hypothetical protein